MNAIPRVTVRTILRPEYDNRRLKYGALWIRDNEVALRSYYEELGGRLPNPESANATAEFPYAQKFVAWCACQYDIERFKS